MNLKTTYCGLELQSPLVASASPLARDLGLLRQMEDAGAAAVVLHSLFEEQINLESSELDRFFWKATDVGNEAPEMFPDVTATYLGPDEYLEHIARCKRALGVPVFASLNGVSTGGWIRYAKMMEAAGADAIELNIYFLPADATIDAATIEQMYAELVAAVKSSVRIPLAVKLGPQFSAPANLAAKLDRAGAGALVLFNRFYQPDFDLENLEVTPSLVLSRSNEIKLRLHWTAILYGQINADLAITGGVHTAEDVLKSMMAGAKVACMTSAILEHGPGYFAHVKRDLVKWMEEHEYDSIRQMQGSMSMRKVANPGAYQRANYLKVLSSYAFSPELTPR